MNTIFDKQAKEWEIAEEQIQDVIQRARDIKASGNKLMNELAS
ncbi:hypothetical protein P4E94_08550 [Pontiellaceae bacterium B12219]|nr:hypothetical protein [Pontiellaceae bacterium B12219]